MKLIILNGPCGVGKSTLAARLHKDMPLSFLLDIDAQTRFISDYAKYNEERWQMTLAISGAVLTALLGIGRSVIIDKMTYAPSVLDSFHQIAKKYGAEVTEIMLWASKETVLHRAEERGWHEGGLLTPEKVELFWDKMNAIKDRESSILINTEGLNAEEVYTRVCDLLE